MPDILPQCSKCEYKRENGDVEKKFQFSLLGWLALSFGMTLRPKKISFFCHKCNETKEEITDDELIKKYTI